MKSNTANLTVRASLWALALALIILPVTNWTALKVEAQGPQKRERGLGVRL